MLEMLSDFGDLILKHKLASAATFSFITNTWVAVRWFLDRARVNRFLEGQWSGDLVSIDDDIVYRCEIVFFRTGGGIEGTIRYASNLADGRTVEGFDDIAYQATGFLYPVPFANPSRTLRAIRIIDVEYGNNRPEVLDRTQKAYALTLTKVNSINQGFTLTTELPHNGRNTQIKGEFARKT
jgi:hypothetical protein